MDLERRFKALLLILAMAIMDAESQVFDITQFGGKPNGDITKALTDAFRAGCTSPRPSKVVIPKGTYNSMAVNLRGPCKAPLQLQVDGIVKAPADPASIKAESWFMFDTIDHLNIFGTGTFDGVGAMAWKQTGCKKNFNCQLPARNLGFNKVDNSIVQGVMSKDSKSFHVNVINCRNITFSNFKVQAPGDSANTDGIHIGRSQGVQILGCIIGTGDDCVSLGDGSRDVSIERTTCGPGHGFSIGSLGRYKNEEPVIGITVKSCTLQNTDNGVRIKTWPKSFPNLVQDITFQDIICKNVSNPINIDQLYCPFDQCAKNIPSKVKIENLFIDGVRGTSATPECMKIACSQGLPCQNVQIGNINLSYSGPKGTAFSQCSYVKPKLTGKQIPPACSAPVPA